MSVAKAPLRRRLFRSPTLLLGVASLVVASVSLPILESRSNCGGNSAALTSVSATALSAKASATDMSESGFRFAHATADERAFLASLSTQRWLENARFFVTTEPIFANAIPPRLVSVCDTPYRHVPRTWFGTAAPTHAASYSDGSNRLLSPKEFATLEWSKLIALDELYSGIPTD